MRLLAQSRWMTIHQSDDGSPFAFARFTIWRRVSVSSLPFHFFRTSPQRSTFQRLTRGKELRSKNFKHMEKVPFVVYADFECILRKSEPTSANAQITQTHEPCSIEYYMKCSFGDNLSRYSSSRTLNVGWASGGTARRPETYESYTRGGRNLPQCELLLHMSAIVRWQNMSARSLPFDRPIPWGCAWRVQSQLSRLAHHSRHLSQLKRIRQSPHHQANFDLRGWTHRLAATYHGTICLIHQTYRGQ